MVMMMMMLLSGFSYRSLLIVTILGIPNGILDDLVIQVNKSRADIAQYDYIYDHQTGQKPKKPIQMSKIEIGSHPFMFRVGIDDINQGNDK